MNAETKIKVLIGASTFASADDAPLRFLFDAGFEVIGNPYKRKLTKSELLNLLSNDVSGLIAGLETIDMEVLKKSGLKVVSRSGSGLSNVDLKAAAELGVIVKSTPTAPVNAVAELTIGCLLTLLRAVPLMDRGMHKGEWSKHMGRELRGMTVSVIGFGNIGRRVAELLTAIGATVCAVDPHFSGTINGVEMVSLDEALKRSDVITLHCSGEERLLGEREFNSMKKGAFILNAARGGLIDEKELAAALDSGVVAGAWIDAFQNEPYKGPLCSYDNVLLTPHIGSYSVECRRNMEMEAARNLVNAFSAGG